MANLYVRQNYCDYSQRDTETPEPTGHKFSDSHSSLSSFTSWRSKSHSRISSATTLNSIHSARQFVAELPLLDRTLSSGSESYQTLNSAKRAQNQATDVGPLPPHEIDEMATPKRSESPSDAVLNMKNANKTSIADTPIRLVNCSHAANLLYCLALSMTIAASGSSQPNKPAKVRPGRGSSEIR